MLEILKDFL